MGGKRTPCAGASAGLADKVRKQMKRTVHLSLLLVAIAWLALTIPAAAEERWHTVAWGDNLTRIAARYDTTIQTLVALNALPNPNYIRMGQRLRLPEIELAMDDPVAAAASLSDTVTITASAPITAPVPAQPVTHIIRVGEYLSAIASRYGTTVSALAAANSLANPNLLYPGQSLTIVAASAPLPRRAAAAATTSVANAPSGKWIEINLSTSIVTAWQGASRVRDLVASLGKPWTPTPPGRFAVQTKYVATPMSGPGYYLPSVPHTMYFYKGYAIHGAYWHNNFGQAMSHGCVNLSLPDAEWLYYWTPLQTPVTIHW